MSDWNKVEREKTESTKVDRTDRGWFHGWFSDWFSGILWKIVKREIGNWNKITRE